MYMYVDKYIYIYTHKLICTCGNSTHNWVYSMILVITGYPNVGISPGTAGAVANNLQKKGDTTASCTGNPYAGWLSSRI